MYRDSERAGGINAVCSFGIWLIYSVDDKTGFEKEKKTYNGILKQRMKKKEYTRQRWWRWWRTEAEITMDEIIWSDYKRLTCTLWIVVYVVGGPHNKAQKGSRKIGLSINTHRRRTDEICRLFFVPVQSFQLLLTHSCALLPFMLLLLSLVFFFVYVLQLCTWTTDL